MLQQIMANCVSHSLFFHSKLTFCKHRNFEGVLSFTLNFKFVVESSMSGEFDGV